MPWQKHRLVPLLLGCALAAGCGGGGGATPAAIVNFQLTTAAGLHGTVSPNAPQRVTSATAITATPVVGYAFAGWTASPAANVTFTDDFAASTQVVLRGDATITATWSLATATFFVNQRQGSDTGTGASAATPFQSLTRALAAAHDGDTIAVAPGRYDTANGETFPLIVPAGVALLGDEDALGLGIEVQGAGPMPGWTAIPVGTIPSSRATIAGIHFLAGGRYTLAYDRPTGGTNIVLRHNTIEAGSDGGLYVQVASGGSIVANEWTAAGDAFGFAAVGGNATTRVEGNHCLCPVEMDGNYLDLGGGAGGSAGGNAFLGVGMGFFEGIGVMARNNRWKNAPPTISTTFSFGPSAFDFFLDTNATIDTTGATH